jgi:hypothetical protein
MGPNRLRGPRAVSATSNRAGFRAKLNRRRHELALDFKRPI